MNQLSDLDAPATSHAAADHASAADQAARIAALVAENARLSRVLAARDSFLIVAAHELRNPMTPILGRVTLLRRAFTRGERSPIEAAEDLARIEQLVLGFIERATTLLDLSRADSEQMQVERRAVDVDRLLLEVAESYGPSALHAGATLTSMRSSTRNVVAWADAVALQRVLDNLVSNAIKYGAGAPIRIFAAADEAHEVARITVEDDGPGIPPDDHARIFERYERAVQPGAEIGGYGVGLWIVRTLCDAMGGTVEVVSKQPGGCAFVVSLPLFIAKDTA